ncbi:multidrug effflux MFS transporter [Nocardioides bruguierae]|uniref:multidrug effflux MFS transporter n=1 Tax=Nocardioides bruguierae TaxID=2945102 RepID=UPI0020226A65|nr:multidrug effflux MFS transporter [Nocardioides bruguierae]MCL8025745.1 multidrug effflux MFS transporter [Nocardioides bruguierae]
MTTTPPTSPPTSTTPPAPTALPPRAAVRIALVCVALSWIGPFSMDAYSPSFPALAADLGVGDRLVQLTLTSTLVGMTLGQFLFAPLSDRAGRRSPLRISLVVYVAASVLCVLAPSIWWLVAARFAQGFAAAGAMSIARAIGRDVYEGRALVRFYSWVGASTAIAPVVGPLAGAFLVEHSSWRWIFVMITGLGIVGLVLSLTVLPETRWLGGAAPVATRPRPARPPLGRERAVRLALLCLVIGGTNGAVFSYLAGSSFLLQDGYGLSATEYGLVFAANAVGIVVVSATNSWLTRWFAPLTMLTVAVPVTLAAGVALFVSSLVVAPLGLLVPLFALLIAAMGLIIPNATALAMEGDRAQAGFVSAVVGLSQFLAGAAIAPMVGGAVVGALSPMFVVLLTCTVVSTTALLVGRTGPLVRVPEAQAAEAG